MPSPSPFAPVNYPELKPLAGVRLASLQAGIRYKNRTDLLLVELEEGTSVAGVLTQSLCPSAPIEWCRRMLPHGKARALIVNSGNANAFTGKAGADSLQRVAHMAKEALGCPAEAFYMASTGVIGEVLPDHKITENLGELKAALAPDGWMEAAKAIMTTDTFPKLATRTAEIGGTKVTIHGIAKGSGMIAPDMATMLAFIFTDAAIPAAALQSLLAIANAGSFNCITVDGDTSTSDAALLFATGKAGNPSGADLADFQAKLNSLMIELAQLVAKDGEGISKFITVKVTGADSDAAARKIGLSIGNSPLVKTAIAGEDANWGRIVMAVGKAGEKADRDKLSITIGGVLLASKGEINPAYREEQVMPHMKGKDILIEVDIGLGKGQATIWTCDLTHGYIDINGSYRS